MHRALETTTDDYVERVARGSDDYAALLRRLEAAHRVPMRSSDGRGRSRVQVGPAPAQLPLNAVTLNAVDTTLDVMIKRLEVELQHRTAAASDDLQLQPPPHDAAATALSAQLRRVLASSRSQVERDLLARALHEAESETTTVVCSRTLATHTRPALSTLRGCAYVSSWRLTAGAVASQASHQASLTAQLSVSRLLAEDLSSLGDELRVRRPPATPAGPPPRLLRRRPSPHSLLPLYKSRRWPPPPAYPVSERHARIRRWPGRTLTLTRWPGRSSAQTATSMPTPAHGSSRSAMRCAWWRRGVGLTWGSCVLPTARCSRSLRAGGRRVTS